MANVHVATFCQAARVTRGDGAHLRREIEKHWNEPEPVVLDFSGVRIASVSFFDESLGLLAKEHGLTDLKNRVRIENIDASDRSLLNRIVTSRARERDANGAGAPSTMPSTPPRTPAT
jgi:hypothetical protein